MTIDYADALARSRDANGTIVCACGCGAPTQPARWTVRSKGLVKGEPTRYVRGHNSRVYPPINLDNWIAEDRGFETPCHVWQGSTDRNGYSKVTIYIGKRVTSRPAHLAVWEREHGPVPPGKELDHLCRVRACVRTSHLESVTHRENIIRGHRARRAGR